MTSASTSSLSAKQFIYLYTTRVIHLISMEIYFYLNAKVLQGNAAVLSILHSFKELIFSARNFHRTITQSAVFVWCLKQLKDFILKFSISRSFTSLNGIKAWVFFGKIVEKKHLCRHDKNHYYF